VVDVLEKLEELKVTTNVEGTPVTIRAKASSVRYVGRLRPTSDVWVGFVSKT